MKKIFVLFITILLSILLFSGCGSSNTDNDSNDNDNQDDAFVLQYANLGNTYAFANETGNKLITFTQVSDPASLASIDAAIGANGQYLSIAYDKKQESNNNNNYNLNIYNFDNLEGYLFNITEGSAISNTTYLLVNSASVPQESLLENALTGPVVMTHEQKVDIGNAKGRVANQGWILASYADGRQLVLAGFEPQGNDYLMSVALKTADGAYKFKDYPAISSNPSSVWRIDDQGIFDPTLLPVLLSADTNQGYCVIINWEGAEGETTLVLLENGASLADQQAEVSRYWGAF